MNNSGINEKAISHPETRKERKERDFDRVMRRARQIGKPLRIHLGKSSRLNRNRGPGTRRPKIAYLKILVDKSQIIIVKLHLNQVLRQVASNWYEVH